MRNSLVINFILILTFSCGNHQEESFEDSRNELIEEIDRLSVFDSLAYVFEAETLMMNAKVTELATGREFEINRLELENKVIGYISDVQCSTCIDQEIEFIKEFYERDEFIILGNYSSKRDFKLYLLLREFDFPAYLIKTPVSHLLGRFSNPTFFRLDGGSIPSAVFFASISTPNKSRQYHTIMTRE